MIGERSHRHAAFTAKGTAKEDSGGNKVIRFSGAVEGEGKRFFELRPEGRSHFRNGPAMAS